ncbi:Glycerol kinase [Achromobacter denitrificans]|uniref:FGGY family carbohydrate kinase n=1 Tax=Achromobacter denitrificans TaxID=32002 RepID=UPI000787572D|nr:FGGY family carbohydrate kinase [Achromobacter denitrificans]OLU10409.1 glycerol kinase [Achromobacter denitrificans]QKH43498.1 glycerol kinase [Achromobacter denitrificans]QKH49361.1 glycerol kinase [Achromobacter denitrificans]CAB3652445.1 Glycerol kinase [Achromobacter denitrificans]SUU13075.1 Glycerol kinase [Achromobacter denitrificans]
MRFISVDQGTTSTRSLVLEPGQPARIALALTHAARYPQAGWVEHDPLELLANVRRCLEAAGPAAAAGLANQGESCLAWDRVTGEPLSPVIVWQDNRTADAVSRLLAQGAQALTLARAGLPLDSYFSASKLAWLLQNVPAVQAARRAGRLQLGTTDAYFLRNLTGQGATEVTTAARTSLMNLATGQWDEVLCELFQVPMDCLPPIRSTWDAFGEVGGTPVTASIVDQQAALFGHGCHRPGQAKFTFGTGAFALVNTGQQSSRDADSGLLPTVAWRIGDAPIQYALDGGVYSAGAAIEWARSLRLFDAEAELDAFEGPSALSRGLVFVPALTGLACPHWDRSAGALWLGMTPATSRRDLLQSMLEGIALRAAEVMAAMQAHIALEGTLAVDGGLANNSYFCQFLCDQLQRPLRVPAFRDMTALGAARLAARDYAAEASQEDGLIYAPACSAAEAAARGARFSEAAAFSRGWHS